MKTWHYIALFAALLIVTVIGYYTYFRKGKWTKYANTLAHGSGTGVQSAIPHNLEVGDWVEMKPGEDESVYAGEWEVIGLGKDDGSDTDIVFVIDHGSGSLVQSTGEWRQIPGKQLPFGRRPQRHRVGIKNN